MTDREEQDWVQQLLDGDEQAAVEFWRKYGARLQQIAEARISSKLRQRVGAEDIVQSVCRTFFRRAQGGQFELHDAEGIWRLLCAITVNKVRTHARFHSRKKRGLNRDQPLSPANPDSAPRDLTADDGPTPDEAAIFVEELEHLLEGMDDEEQRVVDLKLQSFTNHEVAEKLDCSERTVRRMLKRAQSRLQRILDDPSD